MRTPVLLRQICVLVIGLSVPGVPYVSQSAPAAMKMNRDQLTGIRAYISSAWDSLTRSMSDCKSVVDSKLPTASVLYLPAGFTMPPAVAKMQQDCRVQVKNLPAKIAGPGEIDTGNFQPHGLLYLENPYVVPGGPFNEMYGWDSYFIIRGLVLDGRIDLARGMVENFFFEIEHYGTILNANRTYYLTRSQPPFLTSMILTVYGSEKFAGKVDKAWLAKAYDYASRDYAMWTREPHLAGATGLSRYYDFGDGLTPESLQDEDGVQRKAMFYYASHPELASRYIAQRKPGEDGGVYDPSFSLEVCDAPTSVIQAACESKALFHLTSEYYKGDRAMRESGFDISFRFGPYGSATHHFAPVCLNSLLYKTEKDLEQMARILGRKEEKQWHDRAEQRAAIMRKLFWDESSGQFFDYNFEAGKRSDYEFASTFYPLWTGWATTEQARAVAKNLSIFELDGGLATSRNQTGVQWDFPYGWAPLQLITAEGLHNYQYDADADRISIKFLNTVLINFQREGTIHEKYNMVTRSSEVQVDAGYQMNAVGFGWTNGVFLALLDKLP